MTWALVPLIPNEETPARRGRPGLRPRPGLGEQLDRAGGPVDVRGGLVDVQGRAAATPWRMARTILMTPATPAAAWVWPMLDLTEPSHSGRSAVAVLAVGGEQRLGLDRVAEGGAGAVRLDGVDVGRGQPGVGQRLADDPLLGGAVGGGQAVAGAVLVDRGAADHREHRVAVAAGVGEPLQQEQAGALGPAGAVGGGGERLAPAVGGQPALPAELDERARGGHHGDAAGQRQRALARRAAPGRPGAGRPARTSRRCRR